jgi:hypothetical protein
MIRAANDRQDVDIDGALTNIMKLLGTVVMVFKFGTISKRRQPQRPSKSLCAPVQVPEAALKGNAQSLQIG